MSYLQRKANYAKGVKNFLISKGITVKSGRDLNKIMIEFLEENNLPYEKWNNRYKGINTPDFINAETVQENWGNFVKWVKENK